MTTLMKMLKDPGAFFPPGYPYREERNAAGVLLGMGMVFSLRFFGRLHNAVEALYYMDRIRGRTLRPGETAEPFLALAGSSAGFFLPLYLFLTAMMLYHYFYYHRETKSIYLVRRLPEKGFLRKSCVRMPLLGMGVGAAVMTVLFLLYYGIYLLSIPAECMPRLW